jgi:hypothetical protein
MSMPGMHPTRLRVAYAGVVLFLLICASARLFAGTIFGGLTEGAQSVGRGIQVHITCGTEKPLTALTDDYGAYSISVPQQGRCDLIVFYKGQWTPAYPVASSGDPARYDFDLVRNEKGQYLLRRR